MYRRKISDKPKLNTGTFVTLEVGTYVCLGLGVSVLTTDLEVASSIPGTSTILNVD